MSFPDQQLGKASLIIAKCFPLIVILISLVKGVRITNAITNLKYRTNLNEHRVLNRPHFSTPV